MRQGHGGLDTGLRLVPSTGPHGWRDLSFVTPRPPTGSRSPIVITEEAPRASNPTFAWDGTSFFLTSMVSGRVLLDGLVLPAPQSEVGSPTSDWAHHCEPGTLTC
jgi:hypothetical protein